MAVARLLLLEASIWCLKLSSYYNDTQTKDGEGSTAKHQEIMTKLLYSQIIASTLGKHCSAPKILILIGLAGCIHHQVDQVKL